MDSLDGALEIQGWSCTLMADGRWAGFDLDCLYYSVALTDARNRQLSGTAGCGVGRASAVARTLSVAIKTQTLFRRHI
jgi:hypothetical protein